MTDIFGLTLLGFLDGLNVCSLSLLALFMSLMFTMNAERKLIVGLGATYIVGVFTSYLLTGLGILLFSLSIPTVPHLLARLGVSLMIFFGIANVINYFRPNTIKMMFMSRLGERAVGYMKGGSFTTSAVAGLLVGLHNFPCACTGGIYPTFISLVAGTDFQLFYLILYNLLFVAPLVIILAACSNKSVIVRFRKWHHQNAQRTKLILGITMVLVGVVILLTIVLGFAV